MLTARSIAKLAGLGLVLIAAGQLLSAQDVPRVPLRVKEKLPVSNIVHAIAMFAPKCDSKGNIYYRAVASAPADPLGGPITRISADGRKVVSITLKSAPGFVDDMHIHAWAVGLRGEIHLIADKDETPRFVHYGGGDIFFVHFSDEGEFESSTRLDSRFYATHLAVFPTGEFLAAAQKTPTKREEPMGEPFTAVFDRNGKLIKELSFVGDVTPKADTPTGVPGAAISLGAAIPADDGNIYLLRAAQKPLILVISPGGELVRTVTIEPPGENYMVGDFAVAGGKIVMAFSKLIDKYQGSAPAFYSLYDAESGEREIDYELTTEVSGIFACYTPGQFTFLSVGDNGLSILHAVPR